MFFARAKLYLEETGLLALGWDYWRGSSAADAAAERKRIDDYVGMDEIGRMSDADAARDWLRD